MIYSLRGTLTVLENNFIVVECSGVGYKCLASLRTIVHFKDKLGKEISVFTHLNVREDTIEIFAFSEYNELNCFRLLTSVSGVGSRVGLAILSEFSAEQVAVFVSSNDSKSITKASGVGNKIAQRIVLELRDKLKISGGTSSVNIGQQNASHNVMEAANALFVLGYSQDEAMSVLSGLDNSLKVEELIRLALRHMK